MGRKELRRGLLLLLVVILLLQLQVLCTPALIAAPAPRQVKLPGLEIARELAAAKGGQLLSACYVNRTAPLQWRCAQGHEWLASLKHVRSSGSWCLQCARRSMKLGLEIAQDLAHQRGGELLSDSYMSNRVRMHWRCREGHEWEAALKHVKNDCSWCPQCSRASRGRARLNGLALAQQIAELREGKLLSKRYVSNRDPLWWRCRDGHEWEASLNHVKDDGHWCPQCARRSHLPGLEIAQQLAAKMGGELVSQTFVNTRERLRWRCHAGHEWEALLPNVRRGSWCPECRMDAWLQEFL